MRKKIIMAVCAGALVAGGAIATPSAALADGGYGAQIIQGCGASYGQLVSEARAIGHITGGVHGAAYWINSGLAAAHGCS